MKTLRDYLPVEAYQSGAFDRDRFMRYLDMPATEVVFKSWPGPQKNVHTWWYLDNGMAVGWNENPGTGWSFPVISKRLADSPFVNGIY